MGVSRRRFLRGLGSLGAFGATAIVGSRASGAATYRGLPFCPLPDVAGRPAMAHSGMGVVGSVDHSRNGFDPVDVLSDFDWGTVSIGKDGTTVRDYEIYAVEKRIEVAPGVFFDAWSYNGRVPGPSIRAVEGDRIRIRFQNATPHRHTIHFHGIHSAGMDGVPGAGEVGPGEEFTYEFIAAPFGTHLYHCHSVPLRAHIHRGLYGAFIVDPPGGRPPANEMVMILNGFDTDYDGANEIYAVNTIAFAYVERPIVIAARELQRVHVINITEFDPLNSIHIHANFFDLFRTGTRLVPDEYTDTVSMGQAERHMIEFTYPEPGQFMFHAHQTEFVERGWMSFFDVR